SAHRTPSISSPRTLAAAAELGGDGALQRLELAPQELRARIPRLPCLCEPSWTDQEVRADVLQAVLPQQCQGHWLHQVPLKSGGNGPCGRGEAVVLFPVI
ncbi:40S ribosomal protein S29, partial [Zea mays]